MGVSWRALQLMRESVRQLDTMTTPRFTILLVLSLAAFPPTATAQSLRAIPWRRVHVDSVDQTTLRAIYTAPVWNAEQYGVDYWVDTLGTTPLVFVLGTVGSGTGGSWAAFFVYAVNSRWPPELLWSGVAEEEVSDWGHRIKGYHVKACLLQGSDSTLHYLLDLPKGNNTARAGFGDSVPRRSGVFRLYWDRRASQLRFTWVRPMTPATRRQCVAKVGP